MRTSTWPKTRTYTWPPPRTFSRPGTAVEVDDLPALHSLVGSLRRDHAAVTNGLTLPYSSGQVEGTVNKIKMLKRQMFGRANFDLLRKRVLLVT
jgi:transposase